MLTIEKNIAIKVRSEVDIVMTSVATSVQEVVLTSIENLVIPSVELAMKSVNASSGHGLDSVVPDPERRDFSGNIEELQMTASSGLNS